MCIFNAKLFYNKEDTLREDYLKEAQKKITDPNILINVVSKRVKQLKANPDVATVSSLEKLELEDIALLEVIRGNISFELHKSVSDASESQ